MNPTCYNTFQSTIVEGYKVTKPLGGLIELWTGNSSHSKLAIKSEYIAKVFILIAIKAVNILLIEVEIVHST